MAVIELGGDPIEGLQIERLIGVVVDPQIDVRVWRVGTAAMRRSIRRTCSTMVAMRA